jgi:hypothetical protein
MLFARGPQALGEPSPDTLAGLVLDPSGAVVPGVPVVLRGAQGAVQATAVADGQGAFEFRGVPPGRYVLEVTVAGFKPASTAVRWTGRHAPPPQKITLEVAGFAEEVNVGNEGLSPRPGDNSDAVTVDDRMLKDLPAFDLDYIATLTPFLDPGAVGSDGVSLVVDGAEASRVPVSPSAIQEIKINQNPYSAEYFRPGRGRIEVITKEAQPEYHGTVNFLFRDSSLNARPAFASEKAPEQRRIYEGELSGPLGRLPDTTFLVSFARHEEDAQAIVLAALPDGTLTANVATPQRTTEFSGRVTHALSKSHRIWAEYSLESRQSTEDGAGGFVLPASGSDSRYREDDLDVNDQLTLSGSLVNQLFLHFEWNHGATTSVSAGRKVVVQDAFTSGGAQADQSQTEHDFKLFDNLSWTLGRHLLKAGLQAAEWSHRTYTDLTNEDGTYFFSTLADYAAGRPYAFTRQGGAAYVPLFQEIAGGYVQDEFRASPSLSLALGVRYDYQNFLRGGRLAPRLFGAFAPGGGRRFVFRAGLGFFNDRFPPSAFANLLLHDGSHLQSYLALNPSYPDPSASLASQPPNLAELAPDLVTPSILQYSLGAEYQVAKGATLAMTWRGSRGRSLLRSIDANAPLPPLYASRQDASLGQVQEIESAGSQAGDALEVSFKGRIKKVFNGLAQYTLSRTENNTSGVNFFPASSLDPLAEWGPADFDQRHRVNVLGTFQLGIAKLGLALNAASGKPYSLTTGVDANHDGLLNDRPAGIGRNTERAPGSVSADLSLSRDVFLSRAKGEKGPTGTLALNVYNVLNTFNPSTVEGDESSPFFGQAIAALPSRRLQLAARVTF